MACAFLNEVQRIASSMFDRSVLYARFRTNEPKEVGGHGPVITQPSVFDSYSGQE
jgi:hypothetical protein